jgi:hypothetical protein
VAQVFHRHEIGDFPHSSAAEESRQQYISVRQVSLPGFEFPGGRREAKASSLQVIEQCRKNSWRIEAREAHEINRATHAYQRDSI